MEDPTTRLLVDAALAIGIGLFIGLEREHSEVAGKPEPVGEAGTHRESLLGVRTFALFALFGWVSAYSGQAYPWLPVASVVVVGGLVAMTIARENQARRGLTTEVAAMTTLVLGMLVHHQRAIAVALALGTSLLLISKPWFRALVPRMRRVDFTATLQLLVLLAIVLPLLPEEARDQWRVSSPRRLGYSLRDCRDRLRRTSATGYSAERGAVLNGVIGGLASSLPCRWRWQAARDARSMVNRGSSR